VHSFNTLQVQITCVIGRRQLAAPPRFGRKSRSQKSQSMDSARSKSGGQKLSFSAS